MASKEKSPPTGKGRSDAAGPALPDGPPLTWTEDQQREVARHKGTPLAVLAELADSEHVMVRAAVAGNFRTGELLARLAADPDPAVRIAIVENSSARVLDVLDQLAADPEPRIRQRVAARRESLRETFHAIDQSMEFIASLEDGRLVAELDALRAEEEEGGQSQPAVIGPTATSQPIPRATLEAKIEELAELAGVSDAALVSFLRAQSADARVRAHLEQLLQKRPPERGQQEQLAPSAREEANRPWSPLALPPGVSWPNETYSSSPEAKRGGGGIVAYLERVWLPLLKVGAVNRRMLAKHDSSALMAIKAYTKTNPRTGESRKLPQHLHFPTLREVNDQILAQGVVPVDDAMRLAQAARRRR